MREVGGPVITIACYIREADSIAATFDAVDEPLRSPARAREQRRRQLPRSGRGLSPNAWRTVVDITLNGTFFCSREFGRRHLAADAGLDRRCRRVVRVDRRSGFAHSAAAKAGVKNMVETLAVEWGPYGIQVNGLVPGLFPHDDMTADIKATSTAPTRRTSASPPCASVGCASSGGPPPSWRPRTPASSVATAGGRWRQLAAPTLTNPPVVTVREQMGRPALTLE